MNKRIILPFSKQTKLRDMFGTSHNTVRRALKFETRSKFADRIRAAAINEFGGTIYETSAGINLQKR